MKFAFYWLVAASAATATLGCAVSPMSSDVRMVDSRIAARYGDIAMSFTANQGQAPI